MRKRIILSVLLLPLCLLCACAGKETDPTQAPMDFRRELLTQGGCRFRAQALAQTGEEVWPLTLDCRLDCRGSGTVTVLAPESIAGITARLEGDTGRLEYEDLALALGTLWGTELAPAAAPGKLVRAWAESWLTSAGQEETGLLACYEGEGLTVNTWFDPRGCPLRGELAWEGGVFFTADITNFELLPPGEQEPIAEEP